MKRTIILMCVLLAAASMAAGAAHKPAKPKHHPATTAQPAAPVSAKVEEFQQIEPSRITCAFGGFTLSNVDMVIVISKIRVLQCHVPPYTEGINIELLSNDTPGQAVTTKDFGIIKIVTTYPGNFDYQTMWMRPSDAAKLERFLRNRQELHNPPAAQ